MKPSVAVSSGLLALLLVACSALPLPARIDLRAELGNDASGTLTEAIQSGEAGDFDLRHPSDSGECVSFHEVDIPVTIERAKLHYNVTIDYSGPQLDGDIRAQLYAAPSAGELWLSPNKVGPRVNLDLDRGRAKLVGTAVLNRDQIEAINDREVCWGLEVEGRDVASSGDGTATFDYEIKDLMLHVGFSVI